MTTEHILILVEKYNDAERLSTVFYGLKTPQLKITVGCYGEGLSGLIHGSTRPTLIIDLIKESADEKYKEWYNGCVMPYVENAKVIRLGAE